ncbi:MAG: hypothetical protein VKI82_15650 [Leptolyngbya sp.]|nr:hypothetical protein [Leptolyngbya sp.]
MQPIRPMLLGLGLFTLGMIGMPSATPAALAQAESGQPSLVETSIEFSRRRGRGGEGTSRGEGSLEMPDGRNPSAYCILNPGRNDTLWHVNPLFLFQGTVAYMEVKKFQPLLLRGIEPPPPVIWSATPNAIGDDLIKAPLDGDPLEPGTRYEWLIYPTAASVQSVDQRTYRLTFQVMPNGPERDQITTDLEQLDADLVAQGADSATIAEAKATYFRDSNLLADALQILFSVDEADLTPNLSSLQATLIDTICSQDIR